MSAKAAITISSGKWKKARYLYCNRSGYPFGLGLKLAENLLNLRAIDNLQDKLLEELSTSDGFSEVAEEDIPDDVEYMYNISFSRKTVQMKILYVDSKVEYVAFVGNIIKENIYDKTGKSVCFVFPLLMKLQNMWW